MHVTEQIRLRRIAGRVTCATMSVEGTDSDTLLADTVVAAHEFQGLGDAWLAISAHDAQAIATFLLHRDLAHSVEMMPQAEAADLATAFFDLVPEPQRYFTNGEWTDALAADRVSAASLAWDPISSATFDAGIVCIGDGVAAILWVEDED